MLKRLWKLLFGSSTRGAEARASHAGGFGSNQMEIVRQFGEHCERLFRLGIVRSDSITGDIGEFLACRVFNLKLTTRSQKLVDAVGVDGSRWQVKTMAGRKQGVRVPASQLAVLDVLCVVQLGEDFLPRRILKIPTRCRASQDFRMSERVAAEPDVVKLEAHQLRLTDELRTALSRLGELHRQLQDAGVTRGRHVVGDIGETYACAKLGLRRCESATHEGWDAEDDRFRYEIKTRRVYESGRRKGKTRRLSGLDGKTADFLIVVTLDQLFRCSGMWKIPMSSVRDPKNALLTIVRTAKGSQVVVPTSISWLRK